MNILYKINSTLKNIFPDSLYKQIRLILLRIYRLKLHNFSEKEIRDLFEKFEIKKGSVVFIHSSINQVKTNFPFYKLIDILIDIVGESGTLLFPCWQNIPDVEKHINEGKIFSVKKTPTDLGLLPELARRRKDAFRSLSPFNSIVAIGNNAEAYVRDHHLHELSEGFKSPFYKLVENDGIILGIGVTTRYLSFVHCIEDTYNGKFPLQVRCEKSTTMKVKTIDNNLINVKVKLPHPNIAKRDIPSFIKKHIPSQIASDKIIGGTNFFVAKAKPLYIEMQKLASENITIYNT